MIWIKRFAACELPVLAFSVGPLAVAQSSAVSEVQGLVESAENDVKPSETPVDVSDLKNADADETVRQLRSWGFGLVGVTRSSRGRTKSFWWTNYATHQCFQVEIDRGRIIALTPKTAKNCHSTR